MPIYTFECPDCGHLQEVIMGMSEEHTLDCLCGIKMWRIFDVPALSGDLPATGDSYEHYDEVSGRYITSKSDWDAAKRDTGRIDYSPDTIIGAAEKEAKYIVEHSRPGDGDAIKASESELRAAHNKKRVERCDNVSKKVKSEVLYGLRGLEL